MPNKIKIEIRHEIRDKKGKIRWAAPWQEANSLICQFVQLLAVQMSQASKSIRDILNTFRTVPTHTYNLEVGNISGFGPNSIQIGTGTTPVTMTDYKLQNLVSAGIAFGTPTVSVETPDEATWRVSIARTFTNNTGATLNVTEVGLYATGSTAGWQFCIERSLYSLSIPNGASRTLTYRITVTL